MEGIWDHLGNKGPGDHKGIEDHKGPGDRKGSGGLEDTGYTGYTRHILEGPEADRAYMGILEHPEASSTNTEILVTLRTAVLY